MRMRRAALFMERESGKPAGHVQRHSTIRYSAGPPRAERRRGNRSASAAGAWRAAIAMGRGYAAGGALALPLPARWAGGHAAARGAPALGRGAAVPAARALPLRLGALPSAAPA